MIIFIAAVVIFIILAAIGGRIFYTSEVRGVRSDFEGASRDDPQIDEAKSWFLSHNPENVSITSFDGVSLEGYYLAKPDSHRTIALFHGYKSNGFKDFYTVLQLYCDMGFNILLVHQRAQGPSGGKYIGFGVLERHDCKLWLEFLKDTYKPIDIFLSGVSMGCATVLMASGGALPESVHGIIADCGFTSPYEQLGHVCKQYFKIPKVPFVSIASTFSKVLAGYGYKDYSTLEAMAANRIPVLFIHGGKDRFVPTSMTMENYEACVAEKELLIVEEAGHAKSVLVERKRYIEAVCSFIEKYALENKNELIE